MSPPRPIRDEQDAFDRPGRRSRPRTKQRPSYPDARPGVVVTVDRGRYTTEVTAGGSSRYSVLATKARRLGSQGVVVGDQVGLVGDVSGAPGTLARIVQVQPRGTVLRRSADDTDPTERVIVANADQLVIVTSVAAPAPQPRLIDRFLVAAYDGGLQPLLCLTKTDLATPESVLAEYRPLGTPYVVAGRGRDLTSLRQRLAGCTSVLVGQSGVGKSTLVNTLVPGAGRATGRVNDVTGRGRHTSTSVYALALPGAGRVIDTPGLRSFGLAHVDPRHLIAAFVDLATVAGGCPRGCTHAATEPECALDAALTDGRADRARVASFRRLLDSRSEHGPQQPFQRGSKVPPAGTP